MTADPTTNGHEPGATISVPVWHLSADLSAERECEIRRLRLEALERRAERDEQRGEEN